MKPVSMVYRSAIALLTPTGCHQDLRQPELFSPDCLEQTRGWTVDELAEIAFGIGIDASAREGAIVRIAQKACVIQVFVNLSSLEVVRTSRWRSRRSTERFWK
jgi:hypothetical protein